MESQGYTLYTFPNNTRAWKGLIAAKYAGVEVNVPAFEFGKDNKTPEFAAKNPLKKVPVLETPEGPIFESNAIARYFARQEGSKLYGSNRHETALIDQWVDFCSGEIDLPAAAWLYPILEIVPENREATNKAKGDIRNVLNLLNKHLENRTFFVSERLTLADIAVSMSLLRLYTMVLDPAFRKGWTHLNRWFLTCVHQPQFIAVIGEVKLAEKMLVAKPSAKKEAAPPKAKKETPKPKPKPAPKKEEDEDEPKPKKETSALELLPKSSLDLEEWKRVYSNEDTRAVAMPWLWNNMDYEGYSFWLCDYKYNEDNTKIFMTLNLLGGFIQRLDRLRKYGFGSLLIFGEEPKLEVAGVWLFRGLTIPKEMTDCDDAESYSWKQLNPKEEADRKLIEDYFAWNGDFGGNRPVFNEKAKVFK